MYSRDSKILARWKSQVLWYDIVLNIIYYAKIQIYAKKKYIVASSTEHKISCRLFC